jgi:propionate CoA-transferase
VELQANIIDQSEIPLIISPELKTMDARLFNAATLGLTLHD